MAAVTYAGHPELIEGVAAAREKALAVCPSMPTPVIGVSLFVSESLCIVCKICLSSSIESQGFAQWMTRWQFAQTSARSFT